MTYSLHPEVERDLDEAAAHLLQHGSAQVAARFLAEFGRVLDLLVEHPGLGTTMSRGRRIHPFRVFKYSAVYRVVDGRVRILVVRHQKRKPGHGGQRR
jgi:plasmid stabilization system protein ParE